MPNIDARLRSLERGPQGLCACADGLLVRRKGEPAYGPELCADCCRERPVLEMTCPGAGSEPEPYTEAQRRDIARQAKAGGFAVLEAEAGYWLSQQPPPLSLVEVWPENGAQGPNEPTASPTP